MLTAETYYKFYANFPPLLRQVLSSRALVEILMDIGKQYHLTKPEQKVMVLLVDEIVIQQEQPKNLVERIQHDMGLEEDKAQNVAKDLLGRVFLPMEWYLGSIEPLLHELGGNVGEYTAEARQRFPEVYAPVQQPPEQQAEAALHPLLENFEDKVSTLRGKADILLRLTGLSTDVEDLMHNNQLSQEEGERMMRDLEAVSYAVNTQDLNPFEVSSIKRKIKKVLDHLPTA